MGKIKSLLRDRGGFTLIEIIVVAGIMTLFSLTLISVFLATVRGGSKSQLVQAAHQEGDLAVRRLADAVRSSLGVSCSNDELTVTLPSGADAVYNLVDDSGLSRVASNSSLFLTGTLVEATGLSFSCYQGVLGNQVVTMSLILTAGATGQNQEQWQQEFATSVSTRQY